MPEYLLELVTLFHPEEYLPNYRLLPRIERSRQASLAGLEAAAAGEAVGEQVSTGDVRRRIGPLVPVAWGKRRGLIDSGVAVTRFRRRALAGRDLVAALGEPRLVYIADEAAPRPKWKLEFAAWSGTAAALPDGDADALRAAIAERRLRVNQVWVNRRRRFSDGVEIDLVNLVLGPQNGPAPPAELAFLPRVDGWFVSWKE
jgi:hypothetical protein